MRFAELCQRLNVETAPMGHHHARPGWVNLDCPNCGRGSRKYHWGYNEAFGYANCWRCGRRDVIGDLADLSGLTWRAVKALAGELVKTAIPVETARGKLAIPDGVGEMLTAHKKYLRGRGLDPNAIGKIWEVKGIGIAARLQWRLFIPIIFNGRAVSWLTRAIVSDGSYISAKPNEEIMDQKELIYGADYARNTIVIVEGPADVWNVGPGAGAVLGVGYTKAQILRIANYPRRVICFDNEKATQWRAGKLADQLSMLPGETFNCVLDAPDPGSAPKKEIRRLRRAFLDG